jgi:LCCL domain
MAIWKRGFSRLPQWPCWVLTLSGALSVAAPEVPVPAVHEIDWRTSPLDLNLRGMNGERFCFRCPPGKAAAGQVVGSGPYTDGSSICAAGVHAGVIHAASGGLVTIEVRPGNSHYAASLSHYVQSETYDKFWSGSFLVISQAAEALPPDPRQGLKKRA